MKPVGKWIIPSTLGAVVAVVGIAVGSAFAQEPGTATPTPPAQTTPSVPSDEDGTSPRGGRGGRGGFAYQQVDLAAALGITVEELEAARQEAYTAAIQQAVTEGLFTQEEADALLAGEGRGFNRHGLRGSSIDTNALLADALAITVEELDAAKEEARSAALAAAVTAGEITQEQADLIQAREALREYLDKEAIVAEALGMTVEELEAARAEGQSVGESIEAQGQDLATVQAAVEAGFDAAVQRALTDGVITQEQADQLDSGEGFGLGGRGGRGFGGRGLRGGFDATPDTDDTVPSTTPESET